MQSKLDEYIGEYKNITLEQKKAIEEQKIDLLNRLIVEKKDIIGRITYCLNSGVRVDHKTQETVKEIISIEKDNAMQLKTNQQNIRKEIDLIKKRQNGLNSYRKNTTENLFDKKLVNL